MAGRNPDERPTRSGTARAKPFQPAIGSAFDVQEIEAKTRGFLVRSVALATATAVGVSGSYGLVTHNYMPVAVVWSVAGPIVGAMVTHYFGPQRNDTG